MKKVSSRMTFWFKRVLPALMFGFLSLFFIGIVVSLFVGPENDGPVWPFLVAPPVMAIFGYSLMKQIGVFDFIDQVWDDGESLFLRNGNREVRIMLTDIRDVDYSMATHPPKVTLRLRHGTEFGDELSFCPPISPVPFRRSRAILELMDRIDRARPLD
jgi:hypothetical protein